MFKELHVSVCVLLRVYVCLRVNYSPTVLCVHCALNGNAAESIYIE